MRDFAILRSTDKNIRKEIASLKAQATRLGAFQIKLFDENYYLEKNPDIKASGIDPYLHFVKYGWRDGRSPSEHFDVAFYLEENPDVRAAHINPLIHYIQSGVNEGRKPLPPTGVAGSVERGDLIERQLFDEQYYLEKNPDVKASGTAAFEHFMEYGWREGRSPSQHFDVAFYLAENPDVRAADINPLIHYVQSGVNEGRKPLPPTEIAGSLERGDLIERQLFDEQYYLEKNPDVKASGTAAFEHFMEYGWREGRSPSEHFDVAFYLEENPDVRAAHINPLIHYAAHGISEDRQTHLNPAQSVTNKKMLGKTLFQQDGPANVAYFDFHVAGAGLIVNPIRNGIVTGAAFNPTAKVTEIEVLAGKRSLASSFCITTNPDAENMEQLPKRSGFTVSVPLSARYESINNLAIRFRGKPSTSRPLDWADRVHPRALFIPDAANTADGSRIYRAELPAQQLRAAGVEVVVICQEDALKQFSANLLDLEQYDIILLQRVPRTDAMIRLVNEAIQFNRLVFYDTDDLMFKPWRRAEMGVIRSGTFNFNDEQYRESLQRRLDLLLRCHGVICSTPFLQRELASMGIPAILSRNALDDRSFVNGAMRLARGQPTGFKMLFMSGTPTHEMDFRLINDALLDILTSNRKVELTILGSLRNTELNHLPNVRRLPLVTREEMFRIVSEHDLVLVPLERNRFNLAKSSLKFMEAGAAGVPVIASNLFEFSRDIRKSGAGTIARTPEEWRQAIQTYIDNRGLAHEHGAKAYHYCIDNHSNRARDGHLWREICRFEEHLISRKAIIDGVDNRLHERMITAAMGSV